MYSVEINYLFDSIVFTEKISRIIISEIRVYGIFSRSSSLLIGFPAICIANFPPKSRTKIERPQNFWPWINVSLESDSCKFLIFHTVLTLRWNCLLTQNGSAFYMTPIIFFIWSKVFIIFRDREDEKNSTSPNRICSFRRRETVFLPRLKLTQVVSNELLLAMKPFLEKEFFPRSSKSCTGLRFHSRR